MQKLLILAAVIASCLAAPTIEKDNIQHIAQRPTPINPAVVSEPKPITEKIVLVSDPAAVQHHEKQIEASKQQQSAATATVVLHRQKRHHQEAQVATHVDSTAANSRDYAEPTPIQPVGSVAADQQHAQSTHYQGIQNLRGELHTAEHSEQAAEARPKREQSETQDNTQKPQPTQFLGIQNLRGELPKEEQTPNIPADYQPHHDALLEKRSTHEAAVAETLPAQPEAGVPQTLPAHLPAAAADAHKQQPATLVLKPVASRSRRDIPVPLVPKHQHHESAHKLTEAVVPDPDEVQVEDLSEGTPAPQLKTHIATTDASTTTTTAAASSVTTATHPGIRHHPVPVAELFNRTKQQQEKPE